MKIDVFTFIGPNSAFYAEILKRSMEYFKSGMHDIRYKCVKTIGDYSEPEGWELVAQSKDLGHNSKNHADAMHTALDYVDSDIAIFVDCDMCVLYPDWDHLIFDNMKYFDVYGCDYGLWQKIKYRKFPSVFFFCFNPKLKEQLDFRPVIVEGGEKALRKKLSSEENKYCRLDSYVIKCDTGYNLCLKLQEYGVDYNYIPRVLSINGKLPIKNNDMRDYLVKNKEHQCEWHLKGKVFATHLQASRNHGSASPDFKIWQWRINEFCKGRRVDFRV